MYEAKIVETTKELTPVEKIRVKETSAADRIDELVAGNNGRFAIDFNYAVKIHVTNDRSENKEYDRYVFADKEDNLYVTSSANVWNTFNRLIDDMDGVDNWKLEFISRPSRNYVGKSFLSCTVR